MAKVAAEILNQSTLKPLGWEWFINDIFSLWGTTKLKIIKFIEQASKHHQTIKFTAEVSKTETNFLDTTVYKGERLKTESVQMYAPTLSPLKDFSTPIFNLPSLRSKKKEASSDERL